MDNSITAKDFHAIVSYKDVKLSSIGDQFIQHFWNKNATMLCMCLVALYEEYSFVAHVTQRLTISYLIYRLKDMWKPQIVEKSGVFSHPYLAILFKIYWNYVSPAGQNLNDRSLVHLLGQFPTVTPQEGHFVGRLLVESASSLKDLFEMSPVKIADAPAMADQHFNVMTIKSFVEEQLHQFRCFSGQPRAADFDQRILSSFSLLNSNVLFAELEKVVYSLVPPNPNHLHHHNHQQQQQQALNNMPPHLLSQLSSSRSDSTNNQVHQNVLLQQQRHANAAYPSATRIAQTNGQPPIGSHLPTASAPAEPRPHEERVLVWNFIQKVVRGTPLHKAELARLIQTLEQDRKFMAQKELDIHEFVKILDAHPELASEVLLQEHLNKNPFCSRHLNTILGLDISVQTMVTVSRFTSCCDKLKVPIPHDFLNAYVTYCIETCQRIHQTNPASAHRTVRMVCVFLSALVRLNQFDIRPRITEISNFTTLFSQVKETNQLYQALTQLKNATS